MKLTVGTSAIQLKQSLRDAWYERIVRPNNDQLVHIRNITDGTLYYETWGITATTTDGFPVYQDEVTVFDNNQLESVSLIGDTILDVRITIS